MKDIVRSQLYQLRKERVIWLVFIGILLIPFIGILAEGVINCEGDYPTQTYLSDMSIISISGSLMFVFSFTGFVCCGDFGDKTSNYEIMTGHRRIEVYFGRVIPCLAVGVICFIIIIFAPIIVNTAMHGWGNQLDMGQTLLRYTLLIFPIIRIFCTAIFISFVVKNAYILMAVGYGAFMLSGIGAVFFKEGKSLFLGLTNINMLCMFDSWSTYGLEGNENYIYDASLSAGQISGTIIVSLVVSVIFLYLGYVFFHTDDLN